MACTIKTISIEKVLNEELKLASLKENRSQATIIKIALKNYLKIENRA